MLGICKMLFILIFPCFINETEMYSYKNKKLFVFQCYDVFISCDGDNQNIKEKITI